MNSGVRYKEKWWLHASSKSRTQKGDNAEIIFNRIIDNPRELAAKAKKRQSKRQKSIEDFLRCLILLLYNFEVQDERTSNSSKKKLSKTAKKLLQVRNESSLNLEELRELAEFVNQHGFTEFEVEKKILVRLSKQISAPQVVQNRSTSCYKTVAQPVAIQTNPKVETPHPEQKAETAASADEDLHKIISPIVGTFLRRICPENRHLSQLETMFLS